MRITQAAILNDGAHREVAERIWSDIEGNAAYQFNKSHSVEYSIISYQAMYLKTHYPAEYYAAALSILKEEKLAGIVKDAEAKNIFVSPPDINVSTDRFEVSYDHQRQQTILVTPFNRIKGCSDNGARAILAAREACGGKFESVDQFLSVVEKRKCNSRVRDALSKVGAFASLEPGTLDPRHPDRLKDQVELMPGLTTSVVKSDRDIVVNQHVGAQLIHLYNEIKGNDQIPQCNQCNLCRNWTDDRSGEKRYPPSPAMGSKPKFMIISDYPNYSEVQGGEYLKGKASKTLEDSLKSAGLGRKDIYMTSLMKSAKPSGGNFSADQLKACAQYVDREIELLNPPVILAMGSQAIRHLCPSVKGGINELMGQTVYDKERQATIFFGFNPGMIAFDPDKQNILDNIMSEVAQAILY